MSLNKRCFDDGFTETLHTEAIIATRHALRSAWCSVLFTTGTESIEAPREPLLRLNFYSVVRVRGTSMDSLSWCPCW